MGLKGKIILTILAIIGVIVLYHYIGLQLTILIIAFIIILYITIKIAKRKKGEHEEGDSGYLSGIFTD